MTLGDLYLKAYASPEWTHVLGLDLEFIAQLKNLMLLHNITEKQLLESLKSLESTS